MAAEEGESYIGFTLNQLERIMADRTVLDLYRHDVDDPREDHYTHWTSGGGARRLSTHEFFSRTRALAEAFAELGVARGDRVMLLADDRPEWHMVDLATLDLGAVDVPVYPTLTAGQLAYQLNDSGAKVAVVEGPGAMAVVLGIRDRCPGLEHLVQIEGDREPGVLALEELTAGGRGGAEGRFWDRAAALDEHALMTLIYTSGTTGDPKGVMLSHHNVVENVLGTARRVPASRDDLALEFLPLCHTAERTAGYSYMWNATSKAYCSVAAAGELIAKIRPTIFFAVPRVFEKVQQKVLDRVARATPVRRALFHWALGVGLAAATLRIEGREASGIAALRHRLADRLVLSKVRAALGGRVRFCITGAAETPRHVAEFFLALGIWVAEAYGLTEASPVVTINGIEPGTFRLGTVGRPLDNVEIRLEPDGELLAKGPSVMVGYWNQPEATAEVLTEDGFLRTGDIAAIDSDGFVRIVDRKKELIVTTGGKNVAPQPIESRLKESRLVDIAVVVGDRRRFIGALLSPSFEELERWAAERGLEVADRESLIAVPEVLALLRAEVDRVNAELARYEQIREFRVIPVTLSVEAGHLTPTMKLKRRVIETEFASEIDSMYAGSPPV